MSDNSAGAAEIGRVTSGLAMFAMKLCSAGLPGGRCDWLAAGR